jgi:preprotein translocase subunit SecE
MAKVNQFFRHPGEFFHQVRQEVSKVTWPSRRETGITTAMVFLMVFFCSIFFLAVDYILGQGVDLLLRIGG